VSNEEKGEYLDIITNIITSLFHLRHLKAILIASEDKKGAGSWWEIDWTWLPLGNPVWIYKIRGKRKMFICKSEAYIHGNRLFGLLPSTICYIDLDSGLPVMLKGQQVHFPATKYGHAVNDQMLASLLSMKEKVVYIIMILILTAVLAASLIMNVQHAFGPTYIPPMPSYIKEILGVFL